MQDRQPLIALPSVVSRIDGMFTGWDGGTVFRLRNGQRWQQADFSCLRHYAYAPAVRLWSAGEGQEMQVEGVAPTIPVRRVW